MKYKDLFLRIEGQPWLITKAGMRGVLSALDNELNPADYPIFHAAEEEFKKELIADLGDRLEGYNYSYRMGSVGIILADGPMIPRARAFSGMSGMFSADRYIADYNMFEKEQGVLDIISLIDSPGGDATGPSEASDVIKRGKKNSIAYVYGKASSSLYWVASAHDKIIMAETSTVGSVGAVITYRDRSKSLDRLGYRDIEIVSSNAPYKRIDIDTDEGRAIIQRMADDLGDVIVKNVAQNRGVPLNTVLKDFGKGASLIASKAVEVGMADKVQSFNSLITELNKKNQSFEDFSKKFVCDMAAKMDMTTDQMMIADDILSRVTLSTPKAKEHLQSLGVDPLPGTLNEKEKTKTNREQVTTTKGVKPMATLKELLAENKEAQEEYNKSLLSAKETTKQEVEAQHSALSDKQKATNEKLSAILSSKEYPQMIKNNAVQALKGEITLEAFESSVETFDMLKEMKDLDSAIDTTTSKGDVSSSGKEGGDIDFDMIDTPEKALLAINQIRRADGLPEVKHG